MDSVVFPSFSCKGESNDVYEEWKRWKRAFELYTTAHKIDDAAQKKAYLLHLGGMELQDVYYALEKEEDTKPDLNAEGAEVKSVYEKCVEILENKFKVKKNTAYETYLFRTLRQTPDETVDLYVNRLRQQAKKCAFNNEDNQIRDQLLEKTCLENLRLRIFEAGDEHFTLPKMIETGRSLEIGKVQKEEKLVMVTQTIRSSNPKYQAKKNSDRVCFNCGNAGHFAKDSICPAVDKTCLACGKKGHFRKMCRSRNSNKFVKQIEKDQLDTDSKSNSKRGTCKNQSCESDDSFSFCVNDGERCCKINLLAGGVELRVLIDSGANCNVIDEHTFKNMCQKGFAHSSVPFSTTIGTYGSDRKLGVTKKITTEIQIGNKRQEADFLVIDGRAISVLGYQTSLNLGVLKIGLNINSLNYAHQIIGKLKDTQINLRLNQNVTPVVQALRRIPITLQELVGQKIDSLIANDIIEPVEHSDWISPLVVVAKRDTSTKQADQIRLCVDMREANKAIIRENHPLPTFDEISPQLQQSRYFSKLDLNSAFHQLELAPSSRNITTFICHKGLFRFKRLMFGISGASEIFQKILERVLVSCEGCVNFIDDILVFGRTKEEHDKRLQQVLSVLRWHGFTLHRDKCTFSVEEIDFLGNQLSAKGIKPNQCKVEAVRNFRHPENLEEVRSFLGLINYVGKFIPGLADRTVHLRSLLRKNQKFKWLPEHTEEFKSLKNILCANTSLGYFNRHDKTQVIADASPYALGAVLVQSDRRGPRVICYASKSLSDTEKKYHQTEKEALALVWAVERFSSYLHGKKFDLITDHKPLQFLFSSRSKPCLRVERWVLRLQSFEFSVIYKAGKDNIADTLSRLTVHKEFQSFDQTDKHVFAIVQYSKPNAFKLSEIVEETQKDEELMQVVDSLKSGQWKFKCPYSFCKFELCEVNGLLLRGQRIVIPSSLRRRTLELAHEGHPGIVSIKRRLREKVWWPHIDKDAEKIVRTCSGCQFVQPVGRPEPMKRHVLPENAWEEISIDMMGPLPSGHHLIVVVDYFSRYVEVKPSKIITAAVIIRFLKVLFARWGIPNAIRSDNAAQFTGGDFKAFCDEMGIKIEHSPPYWPQANGEVERQNRSILKRLKIAQLSGQNWEDALIDYLCMYRSTPHSTTGISPAELLLGRKIKTKLPGIATVSEKPMEEIRDMDAINKFKGKQYADYTRKSQHRELTVGDTVLIKNTTPKNKLSSNFLPEKFQVVDRSDHSVTVKNARGEYVRNPSQVKKFVENEEPPFFGFDECEIREPTMPRNVYESDDSGHANPQPEVDSNSNRPHRSTRMPAYLVDYELNQISALIKQNEKL